MPFYEYECSNCKFYTEVMQKISDAPLTKCPSCGKKALKKLVSAPNFRLKGGGWYETDFKGDKENKRNLAAADTDDSASKVDASKSDVASKPEATKAEPAKAESGKSESPKPESKSDGGSGSSEGSKSSSGRRSSAGSSGSGRGQTGKPAVAAKPAPRTAASKARPALGRKSKAAPARKKARK